MDLTPSLRIILKDHYLEYRKFMASHRGASAKMRAKMNVLESKLATRPRLFAGDISDSPNPERFIRDMKSIRSLYTNPSQAEAALSDFLGNYFKSNFKAENLKDELELLAAYVQLWVPTGLVKWIPGPLKKIEKAMGKTIADYDFAWGENKDLVRGTLVCKTRVALRTVAELIKRICTQQYAMFLIKQDEQSSTRDGGLMASGYSGWNFVVQFKEHIAFGAEVQANTVAMMYGKHSKKELVEDYRILSATEYAEQQQTLKFPGGLGHALYDIQDVKRSNVTTEEGDWARTLALNYNDACRGQFRNTTLAELNQDIHNARNIWTSTNAIDLWQHAVEGSGWTGFPLS